jgi:membrane protein implicated in regulation of membrane protease activity
MHILTPHPFAVPTGRRKWLKSWWIEVRLSMLLTLMVSLLLWCVGRESDEERGDEMTGERGKVVTAFLGVEKEEERGRARKRVTEQEIE